MGTEVEDTHDSRNLVTGRDITRGTGIKGATREAYTYDGLGRLLTANNFEDRGGNEEKITEQEWEYNTLSLPETHTQQGWTSQDDRLGPSGGYTTEAEYDALGLTVANEFSDGRRLEHSYDGLNRLQQTDDDTNFVTVASYLYSGRRLIEREYGNGIDTTYEYESSGCGCGGFSGLVENVEHEDGSGQTLFQTERRYDVLGNVTAERRAHQGNYGEVHRFDDAYRLTKEYWGAWLGSTNLDTYADPANTPTTFSFQREYTLDTRGNRTEVEDFDSSSNSLRSVSYSPDAETNVYDSVDGQTFSFDDMEQTTYDPTTGLYHAYDYKGQLTESDDDSDFSSPERRYFYDTHGRLRIEERWYNPMVDAMFSVYPPEGMAGGCGGTQQLTATEHLQFDGASFSAPASVTQRVVGKRSGGNGVLAETVDKTNNGTIDEWHYHHEDQLGTLRGMTDVNGNRIAEIDTSKYGDPYCKHILFDGRPSRVDEAVVSDEENEITEITTLNGYDFPEEVEGAVLRAADANGAYTAIVTSVDGNSILIDDPNFDVLDAVAAGADFVIFDNRMGSVSGGANLGGTWDGAVYNMSEDTSLIDADDAFDSYFTGWHVQVDASLPVYFEILDANGDEIKVSGDVTGMITAGETNFMIIHPVGVDPETGATQEDPCVPESRYVWGGGLYLPPVAGFETMSGVEGAQPGSNMSGQHYMWNRVYDISMGRWTTPDPAARPWWNLQGFFGGISSGMPLAPTPPGGYPWAGPPDPRARDSQSAPGEPSDVTSWEAIDETGNSEKLRRAKASGDDNGCGWAIGLIETVSFTHKFQLENVYINVTSNPPHGDAVVLIYNTIDAMQAEAASLGAGALGQHQLKALLKPYTALSSLAQDVADDCPAPCQTRITIDGWYLLSARAGRSGGYYVEKYDHGIEGLGYERIGNGEGEVTRIRVNKIEFSVHYKFAVYFTIHCE